MDRKTINIGMISFYYLPEYSGAAKQANHLIKRLKKHNVNFIIISAHLHSEWPKREIIDGSEIIRIRAGKNRSVLMFWFGVAIELWKNRSKIDLVFVNGMKPTHGFPIWFAHLLGKPSVGRLSIAESDINFKGHGRIIGRLHKWFLRHANTYVAISSALKNELIMSGLPSEKCLMIPNGVDTDIFFPVLPEKRISLRDHLGFKNDLVVLFVGVIDYRKGVDVLIRAFKKVSNIVQNARLVLVGPKNRDDFGSEFLDAMKQLAFDSVIGAKIEFRDYTSSIAPYYQAADLFVLPSRQEGMPNVIIEAMACGLPVIGTRISGTEDLIDPKVNGLLVPPDNDKGLSDAIVQLLRNPETRLKMGKMALKKAKTLYDLNRITDKYFDVYSNLLPTSS